VLRHAPMEKKEPQASEQVEPFALRDCSLMSLATGVRVQNLRELREKLLVVDRSAIYHHFWGRLLQPHFVEPEYNNDFASWAWRALHEKALAERLSMVNPARMTDIEDLRQELVEIVEARLDESELVPWARTDQAFHFIRSQVVVLDTGIRVERPEELAEIVPHLSRESIFYHFIDARRRTPGQVDDFSAWLSGYGDTYEELRSRLSSIDPYFATLEDLRAILSGIFREFFQGGKEG